LAPTNGAATTGTDNDQDRVIAAVADAAGMGRADAGRAVGAMLDAVAAGLVADDRISLPGFGTFEVRSRGARTGRNPATGETIAIAASRTAAFKPGKDLRDALNC